MKGVQLSRMVEELNLTNLTPEIDLSEIQITTAEINRPALQLTGYLEQCVGLMQINQDLAHLTRV